MKKTIEFKETGGKRRRGKITFYEDKEPDKVKKIRPRTARSINRSLQSTPFNPNLYQLNKFAVPRLNYIQTEQVKEDNEKLKALELGLLAQITEQFNESARIKREQEELKKIQRNEQQEEAFLNNQLELFELRERSDKLNDELKNVMTEMNNKNKIIEIIKNDAEVDKVRERQQYELQNQRMAEFMASLQEQQEREMELLKQRNIEANRMNEFRNQQQKMIISEQARQIGDLQANQKKKANLSYQVKTDFIIPESQKREMGMMTEALQMISSGVGTERVISEEIGTQAQPQMISSAVGPEPTAPSVSRPRLVQTKISEYTDEQLRQMSIMAPQLGFVKQRVQDIEQLVPPMTEQQMKEKEPIKERVAFERPTATGSEIVMVEAGGGSGKQSTKERLISAINQKLNKNFKYKNKSVEFLKNKAFESGLSQAEIDSILRRT
jgi:hypothetical protein